MTTTKTDTKNDLTELSEFMARLMGWEQEANSPGTWYRPARDVAEFPESRPDSWTSFVGGYEDTEMSDPPRYAESWALMEELTEWLNQRGYLAVFKQIPRGTGYLMDDVYERRTDGEYPALVELTPVYEFQGREFRTMPRVSAESVDTNVPFDRYCYRPGFCCKTMPEALCKVVRALVEKYPELAAPVKPKEGV